MRALNVPAGTLPASVLCSGARGDDLHERLRNPNICVKPSFLEALSDQTVQTRC